MLFIIEHAEPKLYAWCILEYKHMITIVGEKHILFTNLTSKKVPHTEKKSVHQLTSKLKKAVVLDPEAPKTLVPGEQFDTFIFGGILGDNPPRERTKKLLNLPHIPGRNLGKKQMSTDTAVLVTKKIISGTPLHKITFIDDPEINIGPGENVILPYRYVAHAGKPILAPGILHQLRKKNVF